MNEGNLARTFECSDDDRALICRTAKASQSDRLTPIKDALPDRISFFQIKLALTLEKTGR